MRTTRRKSVRRKKSQKDDDDDLVFRWVGKGTKHNSTLFSPIRTR